MNETIRSELLARYLAGEASEAERALVQAWAAADPAHGAELERLRAAWTGPASGEWDLDRAWTRVSARMAPPERHRIPAPLARAALPLAAALVIALGALLVWRQVRPGAPPIPEVVATALGEQRTLDLPDGTRIVLAPGSELRVDPAYGRVERRVDLSGEAWFEVTHDPERPFRVYAAGTVTEDLGTEFAVRALPGDRMVRVAVVSGAASLRPAGAPLDAAVTLEARDIGVLAAGAGQATVRRDADVEALVAWHTGRLHFEDAPVDSVLAELARWYGVPFRLEDRVLGSRRLTAPFRLDQLDDALETLRLSLGVRLDRAGDTVVVR